MAALIRHPAGRPGARLFAEPAVVRLHDRVGRVAARWLAIASTTQTLDVAPLGSPEPESNLEAHPPLLGPWRDGVPGVRADTSPT